MLDQSQFDGVVVEERSQRLIFELGDGGIGPVEDGKPCNVGQRHHAARVKLTGHPDRHRPLIGEAELLHVAGGAGALAIRGQPQVIEEIAAQLHLRGQHGIVCGNRGCGESGGETPLEPLQLVGQRRRDAGDKK